MPINTQTLSVSEMNNDLKIREEFLSIFPAYAEAESRILANTWCANVPTRSAEGYEFVVMPADEDIGVVPEHPDAFGPFVVLVLSEDEEVNVHYYRYFSLDELDMVCALIDTIKCGSELQPMAQFLVEETIRRYLKENSNV